MVPHLDGNCEIVDFKECPTILLYKNIEYEEYPNHWHTSTEIIMPIENNYQVICNGRSYNLSVGDILIIAPGVVHSMPKNKGIRYVLLANFSNSITSKAFNSILSLIQPAIIVSPKLYPSIYQSCYNLITSSVDEYFGTDQFKEVAVYSNLMKLFLLVGRSYTTQNDMFSDAPIAKQQEYLQKFMTLCEYVNERRITHATLLLLDPENSITDVAINSGFNSISSFIRIFKINKGCTPTEFRKIHHSDSETAAETEYTSTT